MRKAKILMYGDLAGYLVEEEKGKIYRFRYAEGYHGDPVSLTIPVGTADVVFDRFPPIFDGLLPEGMQLDALVRRYKIDHGDLFGQLMLVGDDLAGALSVKEDA